MIGRGADEYHMSGHGWATTWTARRPLPGVVVTYAAATSVCYHW